MTQRFFLAEEIQSAHFCPEPEFAKRRQQKRGRKMVGIRYERNAQEMLNANDWYLSSPWIIFIVDGKPHWCQPDGIHFDVSRGIITVIEIKYSHTAEAHRQLRHVYAPVLARMFDSDIWSFRFVEFVRWYDPDTHFPEPVVMCADPFNHKDSRIGVHIWRRG